MSETFKAVPKEELFRAKESRRRALASLPIEEKVQMLIKLQHLASNIGKQVGRSYQKPWDIKVTSGS